MSTVWGGNRAKSKSSEVNDFEKHSIVKFSCEKVKNSLNNGSQKVLMKVRVPTLIFQKEIPKAVKMKYKDGCK
jgi:hypothetical protein